MSTPLLRIAVSRLTSTRVTMARTERVKHTVAFLSSPNLMARAVADPALALLLSYFVAVSIDGPSSSLFRQQHSAEVRNLVRAFCGEAETRIVNLAIAAISVSRINSHIGDQFESIIVRLLKQIEKDSTSVWYTEKELMLITHALTRFGIQCFPSYVDQFSEADTYRRTLNFLQRRYSGRVCVDDAVAAAFCFLSIDDQIRMARKKLHPRTRSILLGSFTRTYTSISLPSKEDLHRFSLVVPHFAVPEYMQISHSHLSNSFAFSLGAYISNYQHNGEVEKAEIVLRFAQMLWENVPQSTNLRDRSYAMRLSLLTGVPWLKPSEEELRKAIAPLRHTYAYNLVVSLRGLRCVAACANSPREELRDVIETLVCENLHMINPLESKYVLRQLADPRVPLSPKAVDKIIQYVQATTSFDADDLSMVARLVNSHAPTEHHQRLLKEITRQFSCSVPSPTVSPLSLVTLYDVVLRNNVDTKGFFEKATEFNRLCEQRARSNQNPERYMYHTVDLSNALHHAPYVLGAIKPLLSRQREARDFATSLIDALCAHILVQDKTSSTLARRIFLFAGWIALCGTPGRNVNASMRPILQHMMKHHVITGDSLTGFTKVIQQLYRHTATTHETRRLFPILNLFCTLILRHQFLLQPVTCSYAASVVIRRGSIYLEPINRSHQEAIRVCARILVRDRAQLKTILSNGHTNWVAEILGGASTVLDPETRKIFLEVVLELGPENIFDTKCTNSLAYAIAKGDFLYLS